MSGADPWQGEALLLQEQWECVYCGKPVPEGVQQEIHLCCGEVAHVVEAGTGNQMAELAELAGKGN